MAHRSEIRPKRDAPHKIDIHHVVTKINYLPSNKPELRDYLRRHLETI